MSTEPLDHCIIQSADLPSLVPAHFDESGQFRHVDSTGSRRAFAGKTGVGTRSGKLPVAATALQFHSVWKGMSPWTRSRAKRLFDCVCVLASLPIVAPLLALTAILVRLTSEGPVLFLQARIGRNGRSFTILKFRTMVHDPVSAHRPIAISNEQRFTRVGPFLRRWKLDELPQLINVLLGHMSLVGPRPKMREHVMYDLPCRPGITGCATIVFAREDKILDSVSKDRLDDYFHSVVLPAKRELDAEYMAHATFLTDLRLLVNSVLRRWDTEALDEFIVTTAFEMKEFDVSTWSENRRRAVVGVPLRVRTNRDMETEEVSVS